MDIHIRRAQAEDYEPVNALIRIGQEEHAASLPHIFASLDRVVAMGWYRSFSDQQNKVILVAEAESVLVGAAMLEIKKSPPYDALIPRTYAYMNELAVDPAYQRRGIGTRLYQAAMEWAKERGAASLELNVWAFNERAIAFYQSLSMTTLNLTMSAPIS